MAFKQITRLGAINCYLVEEGEELTLLDTTVARSADAIEEAAEELGKPITKIVLTHDHSDHVGSLDALAERLPDAEVIASRREAKLMGGDRSAVSGEPDGKLPSFLFPEVGTAVDREVEEGDAIGSLEVYAAPGHTPGQIALLDGRDGTLFCGDAFHTLGGVTSTGGFSLPFPFPYLVSWNSDVSAETARKLTELGPDALAPGHGKVVERPADAMRTASSG